jgi:hypothetical protein
MKKIRRKPWLIALELMRAAGCPSAPKEMYGSIIANQVMS